jgi:transcription-repair coupling factor (superfamily II helicase)
MYVAMKDLEIRGAGNLLGGEQSGHIEGVGFDLYVRMVGEAVQAFKGERPEEVSEVKIDLPVDAHLPHDYIAVERLRLEMYRKLAEARDEQALTETVAELTDRYGEPPAPVQNLVAVARFRLLARVYGLTEVSVQGKHVRLAPLVLPDSKQLRLKRYHPDAVYKQVTDQVSVPRPTTRRIGGEPLRDQALLEWCAQLLSDVLGAPETVAAG